MTDRYTVRSDRRHGAFIYARFSTEHQHSIEEQVARCLRWCQEHNIPMVGVYADEAVSGTKLSRANYDLMMSDLQQGLADTVVIYDQSRLMRDVAGWFGARQALAVLGVRVYSATQEYVGGNINKPDTYMMEAIQSVFDTLHVLTTREKTTEKLRYMATTGLHTGGKPALGYKTVPAGDKGKRLVIDEAEARIVLRIFDQYAAGRSYREIINALNADGIRTKTGKPFGNNSLHDLMKNQLYTGKVIYGARPYRADGTRNTHAPEGTDIIERQDETLRIIPQETFDIVQRRMAENAHQKTGRPASVRDYPLKGKVYCGECGSAMAVVASKKREYKYFYYRCAKKDRTHDCNGKPIRCDDLEELVAAQVRALISSADIRDRALTYLRDYADQINRTGIDRYQRLTDDLRTVKTKISRIIDAIENGAWSPTMQQRLKELEEEQQTLQLRLNELTKSARVASLPAERFAALFDKLCASAKTDLNAVLSIVSRVEVYNDKIKIYTAFDPDPKGTDWDPDGEEVIVSGGIPSSVPIIIITASGFAMQIARKG